MSRRLMAWLTAAPGPATALLSNHPVRPSSLPSSAIPDSSKSQSASKFRLASHGGAEEDDDDVDDVDDDTAGHADEEGTLRLRRDDRAVAAVTVVSRWTQWRHTLQREAEVRQDLCYCRRFHWFCSND